MTCELRPDTRPVLLRVTGGIDMRDLLKGEGHEVRGRSNQRKPFDSPHIFLPFLDAITMAAKMSTIPAI